MSNEVEMKKKIKAKAKGKAQKQLKEHFIESTSFAKQNFPQIENKKRLNKLFASRFVYEKAEKEFPTCKARRTSKYNYKAFILPWEICINLKF